MVLPSAFRTIAAGLFLLESAKADPGDTNSCTKLVESLPGLVYLPDTPNYTSLNTNRWSNTSILTPNCIVTPACAQEVSTIVKTLVCDGTSFSIKSGGHNPNPKFNNIDNGVTVDLKLLNEASISADRTYVTLGAGTTMGQAYGAFSNESIAFPGGICDGVGVGGISTGGGQSFFLPKLGWFVDNVLDYEIVLASGAIVNANQASNSDLFKALKGGSTNFGIVTKVKVAAFAHDGLWGGQIVVPATNATTQQVMKDFTDFTTANNEDVDTAIMIVGLYSPGGIRIINVGLASTNGTENPPILAPFLALQPQVLNTIAHKPLADFVHEVTQPMPDGYRMLTATTTFVNDLETLTQVQAATDAIYEEIKDPVPNLDWMFSYNPQPEVMMDHAATRGGNSLGLGSLKHDQTLYWLIPRYTDASSDAIMHDAAARWYDEVSNITAKLGTADPFLYLNHAGYFQKPLCATGAENVNYMKTVAEKYDPQQVFQRLVPGGHKLSTEC
ncbi:FAD binding domain protein [Coniochaeta hoffmannii]|uniref:FAD binding domain protein n=1 Tax=Coniochaeta hoffmannii TaxID=91930 RepID=A0AA38R772_9PEZI|nr:FAD binding domain protein [Coniochaeta hoffmannii]